MTPAARFVIVVLAPSVSMANRLPAVIEPALSILIAFVTVVCWVTSVCPPDTDEELSDATVAVPIVATMPRFAPRMLPVLLMAISLSTRLVCVTLAVWVRSPETLAPPANAPLMVLSSENVPLTISADTPMSPALTPPAFAIVILLVMLLLCSTCAVCDRSSAISEASSPKEKLALLARVRAVASILARIPVSLAVRLPPFWIESSLMTWFF